jgi:acyl dehydratase
LRSVQFRDVPSLAGTYLGASEWHEIEQDRVNLFADATDDHQCIHVDPQRAAAGPFGAPIAHGYLTLALGSMLLSEILDVRDADQLVNYGLDKVRFPAPVRVGQRLRLSAECTSVTPVTGGYQVVLVGTFELDGESKPACVAEVVFRYYGSTMSLS